MRILNENLSVRLVNILI